jgi:sigma-B regulation protein RsbQ
MSVQFRNNVHVTGSGPATIVFVHGFGCDQTMWRHLVPAFAARYRVVLYDLTGSGRSDWEAYDRAKYASLQGHVADLLDVLDACAAGPTVVVGHSVGASIALLATVAAPERFLAQVLVGPSPCYINDGDYVGGFNREDIDGLLQAMETNFLDWSRKMAPAIMGAPNQPDLREELTRSFCRNDPAIARHFARVHGPGPDPAMQRRPDRAARSGRVAAAPPGPQHAARDRQCGPLPAPERADGECGRDRDLPRARVAPG